MASEKSTRRDRMRLIGPNCAKQIEPKAIALGICSLCVVARTAPPPIKVSERPMPRTIDVRENDREYELDGAQSTQRWFHITWPSLIAEQLCGGMPRQYRVHLLYPLSTQLRQTASSSSSNWLSERSRTWRPPSCCERGLELDMISPSLPGILPVMALC